MPEPRVAPLPVPAVDGSVPGSPEPSAGSTVPFPARLLDRAMPRLSDTEWRLLCVVVRQTLGWYDKETGGRKGRDWLTQGQLVARTGRTAKPVAQAVASLTARRLIRVMSDRGEALLTPEQRRGCPGRHWFQLHPQWEKAWVAGAGEGVDVETLPSTRRGEIVYGESPHGAGEQGGTQRPGLTPSGEGDTSTPRQDREENQHKTQADGFLAHRPDLWAEACGVFTVEKVHTTKETDYKYINANKHMGESMKERADFLHNGPNGAAMSRPRPERTAMGMQTILDRGGNRSQRERQALTIYGPSDSHARSVWEQEAAGHRWVWRKDLARWSLLNKET